MLGICLMYRSGMGSSWLPYQRNVIFKAVSSLRFPPCCRLKGGTESSISVMAVYMHNCGAGWPRTAPRAGPSMCPEHLFCPLPQACCIQINPKEGCIGQDGAELSCQGIGPAHFNSLQVGLELGQHGVRADRHGVSPVIHPQQVAAPAGEHQGGELQSGQCLLRLPCIAPEGTAVTDGQLL